MADPFITELVTVISMVRLGGLCINPPHRCFLYLSLQVPHQHLKPAVKSEGLDSRPRHADSLRVTTCFGDAEWRRFTFLFSNVNHHLLGEATDSG